MSAILATTSRGKLGGRRDEPKAKQKLSLGVGSYVTITWKGFFTQSKVLLSSIVDVGLSVLLGKQRQKGRGMQWVRRG